VGSKDSLENYFPEYSGLVIKICGEYWWWSTLGGEKVFGLSRPEKRQKVNAESMKKGEQRVTR
jgi:hypothetical protein